MEKYLCTVGGNRNKKCFQAIDRRSEY